MAYDLQIRLERGLQQLELRCNMQEAGIIRTQSRTTFRTWDSFMKFATASTAAFLVVAGLVFLVWPAGNVRAYGNPSNEAVARPDQPIQGSLVIIGGSERFDHREYWQEIVRLAGGQGATIAVFPTATLDPVRKGAWVVDALKKEGADAFVVPLAWRQMSRTPQEIAHDPEWVARVRNADGIFMTGGSQDRIVRALRDENGEPTPMLEAMWDVYRGGGVIAGTSAGAAVMSNVMYRSADTVLQTMLNGVEMGKELGKGLGFLDNRWFVEQHCLVRGRFARALVAMQSQGLKYGIGIDENSAFIVEDGRNVRVIGYKGALVMDISEATTNEEIAPFNLSNVRLTYLDRGDRFNLETREVTPAAAKLEDQALDPSSEDFRPNFRGEMFFNDILGNTTVADLMGRLIDSQSTEAIGLAFDGNRARKESVPGFEFKFRRDEKSRGWYTEAFGGDDYTVVNIRLDVRPVRIRGPLYTVTDEDETVNIRAEQD